MSAPSKAERRLTPKGEATKARILDAATTLMAQRGVARTSLEDVRTAAQVSSSQLYHYFDDKQALIRAVVTRQASTVAGSDGPALRRLDSFEALRAWADAAVEHQEANDGRGGCDLGALAGELNATDEVCRADIANGFMRWQQLIHDGLEAMIERGELREGTDPAKLSYALLAALQGGELLARTIRDVAPLRASLDAALDHIEAHARSPHEAGTRGTR